MVETFGKFQLRHRIAVGGMAEIFLASMAGEEGFAKKLVVKRILPHLSSDPDFVEMFVSEALLAANLSHSNIVQTYDFGNVEGAYFMALEYVDGLDLHSILRTGTALSMAEVAAIGEGVARGLAYAHSATDGDNRPLGIIHRDISPQNIMLSVTGDVKVMDFGIAKAAARATKTQAGVLKGKIAYMAPEQAFAKELDKRCDQFALGLVLWECLTGRRLFQGDSEVGVLQQVMACDIRSAREIRPEVPARLDQIVMRALQRDAAFRYPDLGDMEADLTAFRFSLGSDGIVHLGPLVKRSAEMKPRPVAAGTPIVRLPAPPVVLPVKEISKAEAPVALPVKEVSHVAPVVVLPLKEVAAPRQEATPKKRRVTINPKIVAIVAGVVVLLGIYLLWPKGKPVPEAVAAKPMEVAGTGYLSLRTDGPWVEVFLADRSLGQTPFIRVQVPSGEVNLRLLNKDQGIDRVETLTIPKDEEVRHTLSVRKKANKK